MATDPSTGPSRGNGLVWACCPGMGTDSLVSSEAGVNRQQPVFELGSVSCMWEKGSKLGQGTLLGFGV